MITATYKNGPMKGKEIAVDGLVNRGGWFGETWLVLVGSGFDPARLVIEAGNASEAIDELVDSPSWSHLIKMETCKHCESSEPYCDCDDIEYAGNYSERIDGDLIRLIERCETHYFEPIWRRYEVR